ncbi:MAG TPA: hypothetical protein EYP25_08685 [Anaerolineae bacterium]|nr:hypothetical protein [Caldilineae bacterium]HID34627.1 hypothetical protein [Anaerolineae bacterium]HIQ12033.1 hypothetical protein [Caldilineales bacterium]
MKHTPIRFIATSTALGALVGFLIGLVISQSKKEQLRLTSERGELAAFGPSVREWIGLSIAVVTLLRQIANLLSPKT